jgi:D-alanyl-lipoteichoic acid acyltransferase DltB (MBOAT superfamily)
MKLFLTAAITINLGLLAYFKYAGFLVDVVERLTRHDLQFAAVVLPIGISFYTFTQIAFLVDTYQGKVREARFVPYLLFVTYFPHLIAGPVLHHSEMMPQFAQKSTYRFQMPNVLSGLTLLTIGLFKKVVLADGIQPFVARGFAMSPEHVLSGVEAWGAVLAYTMQLYFDFSGYSDMAIGISRLFNVELPLNFNSPYKAASIVDFWRRWHMTLSRFLRDYLYIPLGGNRHGTARRHLNLFLTMLLGGLWHGAGWTFVMWGALHGAYLAINHAWRTLVDSVAPLGRLRGTAVSRFFAVALTLLAVVVAWTFFRAQSLEQAIGMLKAMSGANGWTLPMEWKPAFQQAGAWGAALDFAPLNGFLGLRQLGWILALGAIALFAPNSQEILRTLTNRRVFEVSGWVPWALCGAVIAAIFWLAAINASRGVSEFIYFNF